MLHSQTALRMLHPLSHTHRATDLAKAKQTLKWQRDPEGMRIRILEAAKQEFSAHGLAGARVDRIARRRDRAIERLHLELFHPQPGIPGAAEHRKPGEGAAPEAVDKSQIDAFAV